MRGIEKPKVSVIVPVYNGEKFIHRCLDSLIYQTLSEIEIIAVDNQSTDNSWQVLKSYETHFPGKVRAFMLEEHSNGPGAGRNLGLKYAHADYIGFADVDDFFDYTAFELMYEKAVSDGCDLVYVGSYDVTDNNMKITRTLPTGTREEILTIGSMVFWNKLIHRKLFDIAGQIPEGMVFEDLAYCPILVSYAQNIGYIPKPLYYYIIREDSGVNTLNPDRVLMSLKAEDIGLQKCNPIYLDYFSDSVAMRLCNDIRDRWQFTDSFIAQLKKIKPFLEYNFYFKNDERNYMRVTRYYKTPDEPMRQKVYLNGFVPGITEDYVENVRKKAFWGNVEIEVLSEKNCDISEIAHSIKRAGNPELVGQYFALKKIYETGGIYLDSCIEIVNPFNCLRYYKAFFGYENQTEFTDKIWGGQKNSSVLCRLIKKIESAVSIQEFKDVIRHICFIELHIPLDGCRHLLEYDAAVFGPGMFMLDNGDKMHVANHNFKKRGKQPDYIVVKRATLTSC